MTTRPSAELRRQVIERAGNCCEYCLIHQDVVGATHQVDHVIAEKHGGATVFDNLALSCMVCNRRKASDIASVDPDTGEVVPLFNPRAEQWSVHFELKDARIVGLTPTGRTTAVFLQFNSFERLAERNDLMRAGVYPAPIA